MKDSLGRELNYLRISVTDRCNLRCIYCMPPGGVELLPREQLLTYEEIVRVARVAAQLGFIKVRLTGGEPLVRDGIVRLVSMLSRVEGLERLAMTTNGVLLSKFAIALKRAGLQTVNISLDTLRAERFRRLTRIGEIDEVLRGIKSAMTSGFDAVKVNMVVMRGVNDDEIPDFVRFAAENDIEVRFIELMRLGDKGLADAELFVPEDEILARVSEAGSLVPIPRSDSDGPAKLFRIEGSRGRIGIISALSHPFCDKCNRLRLTSDGRLRSCLLSGGEIDLRPILRAGDDEGLRNAFHAVAEMKPSVHAGSGKGRMWMIGG